MSENPPQYPPPNQPPNPPPNQPPYGPPGGGYPQYPQQQYPQQQYPQYPQQQYPQGGYPQYPQGGYGSPPPGQPSYGTPYGPPGAPYGPPPGQRSKRWYKRWWIWALIALAVIVAGLGIWGANHVAGYQLADKVKDAFAAQGITVTDVHCPDNINTDKGSTTSCTGIYQGTTHTFTIRFDQDRHFLVTGVH